MLFSGWFTMLKIINMVFLQVKRNPSLQSKTLLRRGIVVIDSVIYQFQVLLPEVHHNHSYIQTVTLLLVREGNI